MHATARPKWRMTASKLMIFDYGSIFLLLRKIINKINKTEDDTTKIYIKFSSGKANQKDSIILGQVFMKKAF
jgi:hypothetical protein